MLSKAEKREKKAAWKRAERARKRKTVVTQLVAGPYPTLTSRQRRRKLQSRIAALRCKIAIACDPTASWGRVHELEAQAWELLAIARDERHRIDKYGKERDANYAEMLVSIRLRELLKKHPQQDWKVLRQMAIEDVGKELQCRLNE